MRKGILVLKSFVFVMLFVMAFIVTSVGVIAEYEGEFGTIVGDVIATFHDIVTISIYPSQMPSGNFHWNDNFGFDTPLGGGLFLATPFEQGSVNGIVNPFESVPIFNLNTTNPSAIGFMQLDDNGEIIHLEGNVDWMGMAIYSVISTADNHRFTSTPDMPQVPELVVLQPSGGSVLSEGSPSLIFGSSSLLGLDLLLVIYSEYGGTGTAIALLRFDENYAPALDSQHAPTEEQLYDLVSDEVESELEEQTTDPVALPEPDLIPETTPDPPLVVEVAEAVETPVSTPTIQPTNTATVYHAHFLNLRRGAGVSYQAFAVLARGETVTILGHRGGWVNVETASGTGWVFSRYLDI